MATRLDEIIKDKRYKVLANCFITFSSILNCVNAVIISNTRVLNDREKVNIYRCVRNNTEKICKYYNDKNKTNFRTDFIQINTY